MPAPSGTLPAEATSGAATLSPTTGMGDQWTSLGWGTPTYTAAADQPQDVVRFGDGFVAVGQVQVNGPPFARSAAWTSPDWRVWSRVYVDEHAASSSAIRWLVQVGSILVALGTIGEPKCVPPSGEGQRCDPTPIAFWLSGDGTSWTRHSSPSTLAGVTVTGFASTGTRAILTGYRGWNEPGIWTSTDGITWHAERLSPQVFRAAHFTTIVRSHDGLELVGFAGGTEPAPGGVFGGYGQATPAAWFSPDGLTWDTAPMEGASPSGNVVSGVFAGSAGLLATAGADKSTDVVWRSDDGRSWSLDATAPTTFHPLASDGTRVLGVGYQDRDRVGYWVSSGDGAWRQLGESGAVDQAPAWSGPPGQDADGQWLFADGIGFFGTSQQEPPSYNEVAWWADAISAPVP